MTEIVLHNFGVQRLGADPSGGLSGDSQGNLYGTTSFGGTANFGIVFRIDAEGRETALYSFQGGTDGKSPASVLALDAGGNIYGTTEQGGTASDGIVFKLDPAGHETVLHNFTGVNGQFPNSVILDRSGNLYGTTSSGGSANAGVLFRLSPSGQENILYSFSGGSGGGQPSALILGSDGKLYGSAQSGGVAGGGGVLFEFDPVSQEEKVLYSFSGPDGQNPVGLLRDGAGNFYGTTTNGGAMNLGVVFRLDAAGKETVLHSFTGGNDGARTYGGVIRDDAGNLYGTTLMGGSGNTGVVYRVDASGNETVLHSFGPTIGSNDGAYPQSAIVRDASGNLYGDTEVGGTVAQGVVYKLDPGGKETILEQFARDPGGAIPDSTVIRDAEGNLYGTTADGGGLGFGFGVVYRMDTTGVYRVLHSFLGEDGQTPTGVILDNAGNLFGTATEGGSNSLGVVFKLDPSGKETILHNFTGGGDGAFPYAGLVEDSGGNFYGTTSRGGRSGYGVVFKVDPAGDETILHTFTGGADGAHPIYPLNLDSAGNLYGTTPGGGAADVGVVFELDPTGTETVLYNFTGLTDGSTPSSGVIRDDLGNLYGTTYYGGTNEDGGVIFRLDSSGQETVLYSFTGAMLNPAGELFRDGGNLYGTVADIVYELNAAGDRTVLHQFDASQQGGSEPENGVILDSAGNVYGTTRSGGADAGVLFELKAN